MASVSHSLLNRFLVLAACPLCGAQLVAHSEAPIISCSGSGRHEYKSNEWDFFEFGAKEQRDKYDDEEMAISYVGDAYGYRLTNASTSNMLIGVGEAEGLYRCISQLALSIVLQKKLYEKSEVKIIDIACGVGRTVADLARDLPSALVVGFDYSREMVRYAKTIITEEGEIGFDFSDIGFGRTQMPRLALPNVFLAQADARRLPLQRAEEQRDTGFDIVVNSMLIDRIATKEGIEASLEQSMSILAHHGTLIFASPFNWISKEAWQAYGRNRTVILELLGSMGLMIDTVFDGLVYRELMDPHGTHLELPVLVARGEKIR